MVDIVTIADGDTNWGDTMRFNLNTLATAINQANTLIAAKYTLPSGGIPATDLASAVRSQLTLASSAYQKPSSGIPDADLTSGVRAALTKANASVQTVNGYAPDASGNVVVAGGGGGGGAVNSVNGMTGDVVLGKSNVGLDQVDNTSDANKPVSTATASALSGKYTKPAQGIPATDLASAVQTSLGKADSAVQPSALTVYVKSVNGSTPDANGNVTVAGGGSGVSSVNGRTGDVTLAKSDVGLTNVDNTSDANKPVSAAQATAINAKYTKPASGIPDADLASTFVKKINGVSPDSNGNISNIDPNRLVVTTSTTTAAINAFLAAGGYRELRGTAVLTDSLIVPSNTVLDATGADITGVVTKNIIQNAAAVPARTTGTGASTAGSTTLTASNGNFTSADVGKQVEVLGAGPNAGRSAAPGSWYGTVVSVTSSTQVVLSQPAHLTVSSATVYVYPARDTNITINGGTWRPGNKNSLSQQQEGHGFRIRRVDNVTINNVLIVGPNVPQMGGQYAISLGDVTRSLSTNLSFQDVNSDGIHYQGPANGIVIQNVEAQNSGDDLVAFTPVDGQSQNGSRLGDTEGDIYDVVVQNVTGYNVLSHLKIAGGTGPGGVARKLTKFNAEGFFGITKGNAPINIVDYAGLTTFAGRIANVHAVGANNTAAIITSTATYVKSLLIEDIHWGPAQGVPSTGVVNIAGFGTHERVIVRDVFYAATSGGSTDLCPAVYVTCPTVTYLEVDGTFATDPATANFIGVQIANTVAAREMKVSRHVAGLGASGNAAYFTGSNWNILSMTFTEINRYTGSLIDGTGTSTNSSDITATNCHNGSAWFLLRQPANVNISACSQTTDRTAGAGIRVIGTTATPIIIAVSGSNRGNTGLVSRDGTQSVRISECICIPIADSVVSTASNGDIYSSLTQNTLRLRSAGAWKNL